MWVQNWPLCRLDAFRGQLRILQSQKPAEIARRSAAQTNSKAHRVYPKQHAVACIYHARYSNTSKSHHYTKRHTEGANKGQRGFGFLVWVSLEKSGLQDSPRATLTIDYRGHCGTKQNHYPSISAIRNYVDRGGWYLLIRPAEVLDNFRGLSTRTGGIRCELKCSICCNRVADIMILGRVLRGYERWIAGPPRPHNH